MASCASASPAAPARLAVLAEARLTGPSGWNAPASAGWDDPASAWDDPASAWDDPAGWDAAIPDGDAAPPTDEELCGLAPDPYCDPPDHADAWAMDVPADLRGQCLIATEPARVRGAWPDGIRSPDAGRGAGFADGGVADRLPPGVALAGFVSDVWAAGLDQISDDQLIGVLQAWRRLTSWTAAGELAVVAELNRRRADEVAAGADPHLAEHVGDELAVSLTLTMRGADQLLDFAARLDRLPCTRAALAAGAIDRAKAYVIADEVSCLDHAHAVAVEAAVIGRAPGQTTGQLRASARRAVLAAEPAAAGRHREKAEKEARVEVWSEPAGTAALVGRDLRPADVIAADKRIDGLARQLKAAGIKGSLASCGRGRTSRCCSGSPCPGCCRREPARTAPERRPRARSPTRWPVPST
jgi:hypothetical protein